ncbi:hypothetical protein [Actinokineospora enzanensis]|uniref:hypothetical protein n=1 Tax=Actinokineospora enzanensis TaxID=155975 RepID=UPI00035E2D0B|nr:hypothetical protein [Actinokineospora enzanensis]
MADGVTVELPIQVFASLLDGYVKHTAERQLWRLTRRQGQARILNLDNHFGGVLAWTWGRDRDRAMVMLADLLAQLRDHHPLRHELEQAITLDELLRAVRIAIHPDFAERAELIETARRRVPVFYGSKA